jgi:hypothetical protein
VRSNWRINFMHSLIPNRIVYDPYFLAKLILPAYSQPRPLFDCTRNVEFTFYGVRMDKSVEVQDSTGRYLGYCGVNGKREDQNKTNRLTYKRGKYVTCDCNFPE